MDLLNNFDASHLLGSGGVATALWLVANRILKPLLESFLDKMPKAIADNTAAVKELIEQQQRASGYTREEHAAITTHLKLLTDTMLKVNGLETPAETPAETPTTPLQTPATTKPPETVSKSEIDALRTDLDRVLDHLRNS